MSSTPSQETVEQTKQQIRGLINEIAELSRTDHPADEYYPLCSSASSMPWQPWAVLFG